VEIPLRIVAVPNPKRRTGQSSPSSTLLPIASLSKVHPGLVSWRSPEPRAERVEVTLALAGCG
jgi:hypothetical protein